MASSMKQAKEMYEAVGEVFNAVSPLPLEHDLNGVRSALEYLIRGNTLEIDDLINISNAITAINKLHESIFGSSNLQTKTDQKDANSKWLAWQDADLKNLS